MKQVLIFCFSIGFLKAQMNEIKIGQQVWTAENLNVDKFRNGDPIPEAKTDEEWENAGNNKQAAWCYFDNDPSNGIKYGKLYNWYAVNDPRGLAPLGCHIPSDQEWTDLTTYLGGEEQAGAKMKSKEGWNYNSNGTNQSGFKGLPGGYRGNKGTFYEVGSFGFWWSSSEYNTNYAWPRNMSYYYSYVLSLNGNKTYGLSVRCLRDSL